MYEVALVWGVSANVLFIFVNALVSLVLVFVIFCFAGFKVDEPNGLPNGMVQKDRTRQKGTRSVQTFSQLKLRFRVWTEIQWCIFQISISFVSKVFLLIILVKAGGTSSRERECIRIASIKRLNQG